MTQKKAKKTLRCLALVMAFAAALCAVAGACTPTEPEQPETPETPETPVTPEEPETPETPVTPEEPEEFTVEYRTDYTPTLFDAESVQTEITELGDGVHLVANSLTKANGDAVVVYAVEVDLSRADIVAGTRNNQTAGYDWGKAAPYAQAQAWEEATGGHVYASMNADFFGSVCVNAFVKDGVILKDSHNDNGVYDYLNSNSDVPASAPMLFGIKGESAQIAPIRSYEGDITSAEVKRTLIQSHLTYSLVYDGDRFPVAVDEEGTESVFITEGSATFSSGVLLEVDLSQGYAAMTIVERTLAMVRTTVTAAEGRGYIFVPMSAPAFGPVNGSSEGDTISVAVTSEDGLWNDYTTILGCRQALVTDGEIASTVTLENTNGAQSTDVPRTAVGIKPNGNVVIFGVESMYYGRRAEEGDPHGMSLPQLAEFIYYYGCDDAANFDGGGSTQLVVRGAGEESGRVVIRSSDTGSTEVNSTRVVMNAILVTDRREN